MATAVFLTLDPYTGELRYTSAGHPPPILLDGVSDTITSLDQASSPPLGWADPKLVGEAQLQLPSQMTLLAYTDGLVERRGTRSTRASPGSPTCFGSDPTSAPTQKTDRLLRKMVAPLSATDDIALLLIDLHEVPATMRIEIPADPAVMRGVRGRLATWLARRGVEEEQRNDTIARGQRGMQQRDRACLPAPRWNHPTHARAQGPRAC